MAAHMQWKFLPKTYTFIFITNSEMSYKIDCFLGGFYFLRKKCGIK